MEGSLMKSENFKHRLIEEVRKREILWDRNSTQVKDAKNQVLRSNAWNDVAGKLYDFNVTGAQCRTSFKSLRDQYIRLYQVYQRTKKKPTWANFDRLAFLEKCVAVGNHTSPKDDPDEKPAIIISHDRFLRSSATKAELKHRGETEIPPDIANYESVVQQQQHQDAQEYKDHDYQDHFGQEPTSAGQATELIFANHHHQPPLSPPSTLKRRQLIKLTPPQPINSPPQQQPNLDYITNFGISVAGQIKNLHANLHTETMFEIQRILFEQEKKSQQITYQERHGAPTVDHDGYVNMQM